MTTNSTVEALLLAISSIHSKVGTEEDAEDLQSLERIINSPEMRKAVEVRCEGMGDRVEGRGRGGEEWRGGAAEEKSEGEKSLFSQSLWSLVMVRPVGLGFSDCFRALHQCCWVNSGAFRLTPVLFS